MKKFRITSLSILIISILLLLNSCTSTKKHRNQTSISASEVNLPKIMHPTFESYAIQTEKGYTVNFETSEPTPVAQEVVLFGVRKAINSSDVNGSKYNVNMIHQTQKIENYEVLATDLPDGIIFDIDGTKYLKTVQFKKK
ncbi:MAG: hypothetical protein ACR2MS_01530 [Weeksellaceae bacterium]